MKSGTATSIAPYAHSLRGVGDSGGEQAVPVGVFTLDGLLWSFIMEVGWGVVWGGGQNAVPRGGRPRGIGYHVEDAFRFEILGRSV